MILQLYSVCFSLILRRCVVTVNSSLKSLQSSQFADMFAIIPIR